MIAAATDPDTAQDDNTPEDDTIMGIITEGWRSVVKIANRVDHIVEGPNGNGGITRKRIVNSLATTRYEMNPSTGDYDPVKFPLPRTFADLRALATRTQHPHLQKSILMWRAAVIHAHKATAAPDLHTRSHLQSMLEKYTSAVVTALPSCPGFRLGRDEFGFHLRARLRLPSLLSPYPRLCASRVLQHAGVRQAMHDGARDSLLTTSVLSDHVVRPEPARFYRVPGSVPARYTKPGGLIQV